ncbi:class I SAM-dependent methyltransferase [Inquilinus sp. YAF38]|uniref:class I SAM-dependent methyltransferase n=1 Tax=Inquilinus sp. YAF38 TaxID=3233084 RepID=UPI003F91A12B
MPHIPPVSAWVARFAPLVPKTAPVLDLACGSGRHLRHFRAHGHAVTGVDIDLQGVADLAGAEGVEIVQADIEAGPWPFAGRRFAGIVVANYLHRPLLPAIVETLAAGGVLIYETFAQGNQRFGRPSTPAYLLKAGELLEAVAGRLQVVAYEHGEVASPRAAVVQRLCAVADRTPVPALAGSPEPHPLPAP